MTAQAPLPRCPVCGFNSIFTDGHAPCSVSCAVTLVGAIHEAHSLTLDAAMLIVTEEAEARGLPARPHSRDIREAQFRYVRVIGIVASAYWRLDRELLSSGINVEYVWLPHRKGRMYRFAPSVFRTLPAEIQDYPVLSLTEDDLDRLDEYWHFLKVPDTEE